MKIKHSLSSILHAWRLHKLLYDSEIISLESYRYWLSNYKDPFMDEYY